MVEAASTLAGVLQAAVPLVSRAGGRPAGGSRTGAQGPREPPEAPKTHAPAPLGGSALPAAAN